MNDSITETDKLHCAERELLYRRRVYARLMQNGKMTPNVARREISLMEAIVEDYRVRSESERLV
jgi:hypothetical protein